MKLADVALVIALGIPACGDDGGASDGATTGDASTSAATVSAGTVADVSTGAASSTTEGGSSGTDAGSSTSTGTASSSGTDTTDGSGSESTGAPLEPFECDWTVPVEVNDDVTFTAQASEVAIDAAGNATVVFQQTITTNPASVQSRRYEVSGGAWALDTVVLEGAPELATTPHVALAPGGDGIAVWTQNGLLRANRYDAATNGWAGDEAPAVGSPHLSRTYAAIDPDGNAFVAWDEDGATVQITATRYDIDTGAWSPAQALANSAGDAEVADLTVDGLGNAFIVWGQSTGVFAARFDATAETWSAGQQVIAIPPTSFPIVTADDDGNALVFRTRQIANDYEAVEARYDAASGSWQAQSVFDNEGGRVPVVALGGSGDGFALYGGAGGADEAVSAARYDGATGTWGPGERLDIEQGYAGSPQIDVNASGHAVAVWTHNLAVGRSVWAACFDASTQTWGAAQQISDLDDSWNGSTSLALNDAGDVTVIWGHDVLGSARIQAVRRQ